MTVTTPELEDTGGIPVGPPGAMPGGLVTRRGQVQYGDVLTGAGTAARWRELIGWRDTPEAQVGDAPRPQAHGVYAGTVLGDSLTVTYTYLLRGLPEAKLAALATLEAGLPMDGVERPLVVDDGAGPTMRMARVIGRQLPMDKSYRVGPVECSVQFLCADPRRYGLQEQTSRVRLPASSGGLEYPLSYPLSYGESSSGAVIVRNRGGAASPLRLEFVGPLESPEVVTDRWRVGFAITLAAGERLVVDTSEGTALLNGTADRLYTINPTSDPLELCTVQPGPMNLSLVAPSGTGYVSVSWRDAHM